MLKPLRIGIILLSITLSLSGCNNDNSKQTADNNINTIVTTATTETDNTQTTDDTNKTQKAGHSSASGTLTNYTAPTLVDGRGKKLFAIYMVGSDLEDGRKKDNTGKGAGSVDLNELIEGYKALEQAQKDKLDVVIAFGGAKNWSGMRIANIEQLVKDQENKVYSDMASNEYLYYAPEAHMGDKSSLSLFTQYLKDGYGNHELKFLTMWDHGAAYGVFGNDSNYNSDGLGMKETDQAFTTTGMRFDAIGYDACLNANFELASVIQKHADYLVASPELEPGHGWDYTDLLDGYADSANITEFSKGLIDDFVTNENHTPNLTLSIVDLKKYAALRNAVDEFATVVTEKISTDDVKSLLRATKNIKKIEVYGKTRDDEDGTTYDLHGLAEIFKASADSTIKAKAVELQTSISDYVVYSRSDTTRPKSKGVTIVPIFANQAYSVITQAQVPSANYWQLMLAATQNSSADTSAPQLIQEEQNVSLDNINIDTSESSDNMGNTPDSDASSGTSATFLDENLDKVSTYYGNILTEEDGRHFLTIAELPALSSNENSDQYFSAQWNKKWFILHYSNDDLESVPLTMRYDGEFVDNTSNKILTRYSGEIDFIKKGKQYDNETPFDLARINLVIDENNKVVSHNITPYSILTTYPNYVSEEETGEAIEQTQFEKYNKPLQIGDQVRLFYQDYNMDTDETVWASDGDFFTVSKTPTFSFEVLEFADEQGNLLDYYNMIVAKDSNGNITTTTPVLAEIRVDDDDINFDESGAEDLSALEDLTLNKSE